MPRFPGTDGVILNYYERYCGDYQRDTAHLSLAEHGAYTMLLDTYFSVEKPLSSDLPSLYRVCRAMTRLEQQAVKSVAEQFFPISKIDGLRHNQRADREIAKARPKIEAARTNGRKGGRPSRQSVIHTSPIARQETSGIPSGLSVGLDELINKTLCGEPDGKAHQHQPQHQLHAIEDTHCAPDPALSFNSKSGARLDKSFHPETFHAEFLHEAREHKTFRPVPVGMAGTCCKALVVQGIQGCNPHHPVFLALLQAGAVEEEFMQAARNAVARGKTSFAYVVGTVKRQREEAAKLVLHHGRMPNGQELLESSNKAAAKGWLPPELRATETRGTDPRSTEPRETQHAS
jgi:uncharacterized protein YdaU (DUF1376 family)